MATCASCGAENREGAKFCDSCGAPLTLAPAHEQRKTVTVLFCDVTGSTSLGEAVDPEALRTLLARYFERMKTIVESHGGTVEKFIGDAVMAVFGVPVLHEDDALRAVRAAAEMRDALPELGVRARIGVNSGEVVTGTAERLATGDAVNVAARLEQAAAPGEVLLGEEAFRLVRGAVEAEPVPPLALKGKSEPVLAFRLLSVREAEARRGEAAFVGRSDELESLRRAFARAEHERTCVLYTLLGAAGVGKSRLVDELLAKLDGPLVARGRCLSYGEGITYFPVVEVLKQLLGPDPETRLGELTPDAAASSALRGLLGAETQPSSPPEAAWAFRKLLEAVAQARPLVVVFDDVHWGEPTFLDLVEHIGDLSRDAPILLLCVARPELLEKRPGWAGGKLNATTALLQPLAATETGELIAELLAGDAIEDGLRTRIGAAADGNPLFVEEMVAMVRESGSRDVVVPPTIHALLAARLDQLPREERVVLERGAIEGKEFHRGTVVALAPEERDADARLTILVRKDLIRPERATFPGEDAYRFRHLLIRDAAYDALPKATRVELHERFAAWLDERGTDLVEQDEIVGYHLEQAYRYSAELGQLDPDLGVRAASRLGESGHRALARGDAGAAKNLLSRAASLLPADDAHRIALLIELGNALIESAEFAEAESLLEEVVQIAAAAGNEPLYLLAELERLSACSSRDSDERIRSALFETATRAIPVFEAEGDDTALARAWNYLSDVYWAACRWGDRADALERALVHARRAGDARAERQIVFHLAVALVHGPMPVSEMERRGRELLAETEHNPALKANVRILTNFASMARGDFVEARRVWERQIALLRELGQTYRALSALNVRARIEKYAGELELAAEYLRESCDGLEAVGETNVLSTFSGEYALVLAQLGRFEEAAARAATGRRLAATDDVASQILWRLAQARVQAYREEHADAERLAREALAMIEETDQLEAQGGALLTLGSVLESAGRKEEAAAAIEEAVRRFERKGLIISAEQARARLAEVTA